MTRLRFICRTVTRCLGVAIARYDALAVQESDNGYDRWRCSKAGFWSDERSQLNGLRNRGSLRRMTRVIAFQCRVTGVEKERIGINAATDAVPRL